MHATPDYDTDLNAAIELLKEGEGALSWDVYMNRWEASIPSASTDGYFIGTSPDNPSYAICLAYCHWKGITLPEASE